MIVVLTKVYFHILQARMNLLLVSALLASSFAEEEKETASQIRGNNRPVVFNSNNRANWPFPLSNWNGWNNGAGNSRWNGYPMNWGGLYGNNFGLGWNNGYPFGNGFQGQNGLFNNGLWGVNQMGYGLGNGVFAGVTPGGDYIATNPGATHIVTNSG